jgi:hypothetical protein
LFSTQVSHEFFGLYPVKESPANFGVPPGFSYNMSIGFRHDSPVASPYGYTALLHQKSWRKPDQIMDKKLIEGKKLGAIWFVSHCTTPAKRENLVNKLKVFPDLLPNYAFLEIC